MSKRDSSLHRFYNVARTPGGTVTLKRVDETGVFDIGPSESLAVCRHSPDGFEFGYSGSGPSQLALAILLAELNDAELARKLYQDFKSAYIAPECGDSFSISAARIQEWVRDQTKPRQEA